MCVYLYTHTYMCDRVHGLPRSAAVRRADGYSIIATYTDATEQLCMDRVACARKRDRHIHGWLPHQSSLGMSTL